jgi:hypothetical protein
VVVCCITPVQGEVLQMNTIDGLACVRVDLTREQTTIPSHAVLDIGVRAPALIHPRTGAAMGLNEEGPLWITFTGQDIAWPALTAVPAEIEPIERFSAVNSVELGEIPAAVVLGLPAFHGVLTLTLATGEVAYGLEPRIFTQAVDEPGASGVIRFDAEAYGYWMTALGPNGRALRVRLASGERTTRINSDTSEALGFPGGDLPTLELGGLNLADYTVLEPSNFSELPDPKPDINLGTDLLRKMRVVIDVPNQRLVLIPLVEPEVSPAVRAYLSARARGDADSVEALLRDGLPQTQIASASETLVRMRLDGRPLDIEAAGRAFELLSQSIPEERRAMALVRVADDAISREEETPLAYDAAEAALDVAQASAAKDLDGAAAHQIAARRGLIALVRGDYDEARRGLIAARFGLPQDPYVNFWLGRLYEVTDQPMRSWSRYAQSALADKPPIGALRGLGRLTNDPALRAQFSTLQMQMLLEGQIDALRRRPASAERLNEATRPLIELFVEADHPGAEQVMRGWAAMSQMFPQFGLVTHHFENPLARKASADRLKDLAITQLPAVAINGRVVQTPRDVRDDVWFDALVEAVVTSQDEPGPDELTWLEADIEQTPEAIRVTLRALDSPARHEGQLRLWLLERLVFWPSQSKAMFHDWPVRDAKTISLPLAEQSAETDEPIEWEITLKQLDKLQRRQLSLLRQWQGRTYAFEPKFIDTALTAILVVWESPDGRCLGWKQWAATDERQTP